MNGAADHPLRIALAGEVHARPYAALSAPERLSHLAMLSGEGGASADRAHLLRLCERLGVAAPPAGATHVFQECGAFRLKWERHAEFCSWTFIVEGGIVEGEFADPFAPPALAAVPADWLAGLPGQRLVATHVAFVPANSSSSTPEALARTFDPDTLAASRLANGGADVWTDFRLHADGFGRILVQDRALARRRQAGRMVQRLLEIETYRLLALLALPQAREIGPLLTTIDGELGRIVESIRDTAGLGERPEEERRLLGRLLDLAAEIERMSATSHYRFGAARAYYALVERRIRELREARVEEGTQTIGEFMERRLAPAMRTCLATSERLGAMAERLVRAGTLLRTRVEIALEAQNQAVLASMDRRARMQLRLQQTVEGLSVVAITYYAVGLLGYALAGLEAAGLVVRHALWTGIAVPAVAGLTWIAMRRVRRAITKPETPARPS